MYLLKALPSLWALVAGTSSSQELSVTVAEINQLQIQGGEIHFSLSSNQGSETNSSSTYSFATDSSGKKIVGRLDSAMPTGTTLEILLNSAGGGDGISQGYVSLVPSNQDLLINITDVAGVNTLTYRFTVDGVTVPQQSRVVELILTES
jgi:hypothetical protein